MERLKATINVCPALDGYFRLDDHFANDSIYHTIEDIALQLNQTAVLMYPHYATITPILTEGGLCFSYNGLNSHEMFTDEYVIFRKIL